MHCNPSLTVIEAMEAVRLLVARVVLHDPMPGHVLLHRGLVPTSAVMTDGRRPSDLNRSCGWCGSSTLFRQQVDLNGGKIRERRRTVICMKDM